MTCKAQGHKKNTTLHQPLSNRKSTSSVPPNPIGDVSQGDAMDVLHVPSIVYEYVITQSSTISNYQYNHEEPTNNQALSSATKMYPTPSPELFTTPTKISPAFSYS